MSSYTRKLVTAALVSVFGIIATQIWFRYASRNATGLQDGNLKTVAHIDSARNEVAKRPKKRVIWQRVDADEPLFSGEAVRTSSDAEAHIVFDSGAEVDLDPDSMIVIEDAGDKVNLDFVKGNLYVKGSGQKEGSLALRTGDTSILVQNADMSVGKSGEKSVDLQVTRGSAQVSSGDKKIMMDKDRAGHIGEHGLDLTQQFLKIRSPTPNERLFLRIEKDEPVGFSWQPVPDDYEVSLQTGTNRSILAPAKVSASGGKGELTSHLKPGTLFWSLVATNKKDPAKVYRSPVYKLTLISEVAPKLLSPQKDEQVVFNGKSHSVDFRWTNPSRLTKLNLEVSRDPKFQKTDFSEVVEDTGVKSLSALEPGVYYWRISGFRPSSAVGLTSEAGRFNVLSKFQLVAPSLKSPEAGSHLSFENVSQSGVYLAWNMVPGASKYRVSVDLVDSKGQIVKDKRTSVEKDVADLSQMRFIQKVPGQYRWAVSSVDAEGKASSPSEPWLFTVEDMPKLAWLDQKQSSEYFYATPTPTVSIGWRPAVLNSIKKLSYRLRLTGESGNEVKTASTDKTYHQTDVPGDGIYHAQVEAVDEKGTVVARSINRDIVVHMRPLLAAPAFSPRLPATLTALKNGSANLSWESVPGARTYMLEVKSESGKVVRQEKTAGASAILKGLMPGTYKVTLAGVDEYGRTGIWSDGKPLSVPQVSDLKPPSFKKLKIK